MPRFFFLWVCLYFFSTPLLAASSGWRQINAVGCNVNDDVCLVQIDGEPLGPATCTGNGLHWDRSSPNGSAIFLLLATAFHANRYVSFEVKEDCFSLMPEFPSFDSVVVTK